MSKRKQSLGDAVVVGSAVAGAVLGAAAVLLSDKKNQETIKKAVDDVSHEAVIFGKSVRKKVDEFTMGGKKSTQKAKMTVKKEVKTTKKAATKPTKVYTPLKKKV